MKFRYLLMTVLALMVSTPTFAAEDPHTHDLVKSGQFVASGKSYEVDFGGDLQFLLNFKSDKKMTFTSLKNAKISQTVDISVTELRPQLYLITWKEKDGTNVVHVEDFEKGRAYTNISMPDGSFYRKRGSLKKKN